MEGAGSGQYIPSWQEISCGTVIYPMGQGPLSIQGIGEKRKKTIDQERLIWCSLRR